MSNLKRVKSLTDLNDIDIEVLKKKGKSLQDNAKELETIKIIIDNIGLCPCCVDKAIEKADKILESMDLASCEASRIINEKARQLSVFNQLEQIYDDKEKGE